MSCNPSGRRQEGFPPELRVRRQADFDRVYQANLYAADEVLVINACRNGLSFSRLGLSVSRKVGSAVVRNRWKRLIREVFRRRRSEMADGFDIVARPRRGAQPDYHAIDQSLPDLVARVARRVENKTRSGGRGGRETRRSGPSQTQKEK